MGRQSVVTHPLIALLFLPAYPIIYTRTFSLSQDLRINGPISHHVVALFYVASDVHLKSPLSSLLYSHLLPMLISCIDTYLRTFPAHYAAVLFLKVTLENLSTIPCPC